MFFVREFFFFRKKTAYELRISDWSSDVCSSDLRILAIGFLPAAPARIAEDVEVGRPGVEPGADPAIASRRARQRVQPAYLGADRAGDVLDQRRIERGAQPDRLGEVGRRQCAERAVQIGSAHV